MGRVVRGESSRRLGKWDRGIPWHQEEWTLRVQLWDIADESCKKKKGNGARGRNLIE